MLSVLSESDLTMSISPSGFFRLPNELLLIVATKLNQRDLVFLSCTCKSNFNLLKPTLAGFKLFDALLDGNDNLARQLTGQPFIDLSVLHKGLSLLHVAVAQESRVSLHGSFQNPSVCLRFMMALDRRR